MAKNKGFGELRETASNDEDFLRPLGERMGRSRSTNGKRAASVFVWVVVISFLLLTVLSAFQVNNNRTQNLELRAMMQTQYNPSFKTRFSDLGSEVIRAWYNTNPSPSPVPLASGVTWPHSTVSDLTDYESDATPTAYKPSIAVRNVTYIGGRQQVSPDSASMFYEIDIYSAYVDGTLSTIAVTFAIPNLDNYTDMPTLMGEPSVLPNSSALSTVTATDKPSWRDVTATNAFKAQLESWAKAYTTNDNGTIKQITGDNSGSFYLGALSSKPWEYIDGSASIVWMKENNGDTSAAVAQITWKMKLPDYTVNDPSNPDTPIVRAGATQTQRLEILVKDPASGLPLIQAWGPVGSYPTLNAETNRLTEEQFNKIVATVRASNGSAPVDEVGTDTGSNNGGNDQPGDGVSTPTPTGTPTGTPTPTPSPSNTNG